MSAPSIAGSAITFTANADQVGAVIGDLKRSVIGLEKMLAGVGRTAVGAPARDALGGMARDIAVANRQAGLLARSLGGVSRATLEAGRIGLKGATLGLGVAAAGAGLDVLGRPFDLAREAVGAAADAQKTAAAYEVLTGSADKAAAVIGDLRKYAAESPLGTKPILETGQALLSMGIAADQVKPTVRALGDVAAGDADKLKRVALAYGQVATAGQLYATELKQFTEAGVPLLDELAKVMGKPKEAMRGLIEDGKVGFPEVVKAVKGLTTEGGRFAGMSEKYGKTFAGQMERMKDAADSFKRELGESLIRDLKLGELADRTERWLGGAKGQIDALRPSLSAVGNAFGLMADAAELAATRTSQAVKGLQAAGVIGDLDKAISGARVGIQLQTAVPPPPVPPAELANRQAYLEGVARVAARRAMASDFLDQTLGLAPPRDLEEVGRANGQLAFLREKARLASIDVDAGRRPLLPLTRADFANGAVEPYSLSALGGAVAPHGMALGSYPGRAPAPPLPAEYKPGRPVGLDALAEQFLAHQIYRPTAPPPTVYSPQQPPPPRPPEPLMTDQAAALGAMTGGFGAAAVEADRLTTAFGGLVGGVAGVGLKLDQLRTPNDLPGKLVQDAGRLNQQFRNPADDLKEYATELDRMVRGNLISPDVRNLAFGQRVQETAGRYGLGGPPRLADAAEFGSREFARLQAQAVAGQGDVEVKQLLRQMLELMKASGKDGEKLFQQVQRLVTPGTVNFGAGG